ncbi:MAG: DMT family transporter [Leptospiraceae bacterium]|nr:DMT family transporter [Leptospiraceae bacterium]
MNRVLFADFVLLLLNVMWGYCFILIKQLLVEISPFYLLTLRFFLAALILVPFQFSNFRKMTTRECKSYFLCGLALGIGFIFQTLGLISTNPGKSGVITGTLVVFVPFIHYFWTGLRIEKYVIKGTILTFVGLYFISVDGKTDFTEINQGDLFLLAGAISFAFHVVIVDRTLSDVPEVKPILFAQVQLFIVGLLSIIPVLYFDKTTFTVSYFTIYGILFLAIFGSLIAYIVQTWAQKFSPAPHVAVILSTEAVFACIFSYFLFDEKFTVSMWIGAILVLAGILLTQGLFFINKKSIL